jgi:hypothetical protein
MKVRFSLIVLCLAAAAPAFSQQPLSNDSVDKMVKAGLDESTIMTMIQNQPGHYDLSVDALVALKKDGVSDKVIGAMAAHNNQPVAPAPVPTPAAAAPSPAVAPPQPVATDPAAASPPEASGVSVVTGSGTVTPGSRVVIAPMGGFETYFAAAVREKAVPITLTLDKASAQFFVVSTNTEWQGFIYGSGGSSSWGPGGGTSAHGASASSTRGLEASIMLIDARSKDVVWAYEVHKNSHGSLLFGTFGARGQQSIAEACAKHLKEFIEKGK